MLTLPVVPQKVLAVDLPSKVGNGHRLKTIIVNNYHPYTFMNDKGEPDGFSVEIARAVTGAMDLELDIRADKWDQAMKELESGGIDLLPMMARSPERDKIFDFSVPHTIAYDSIFIKKGTTYIRTLKDLSGKTVIVMNRDAAHSYLLSSGLAKTMEINLVDSLPEALKQLAAGKGDAAIMPKLVGIITAKKLNLQDIETSPQLIDSYTRPFSFAVKNGNQALLERLNQGLNIIKSTGQYDVIYKKWFGALENPHIYLKTVLKFGSLAALILLGFIVWNVVLNRRVKLKTAHLQVEIKLRQLREKELEVRNAELERFNYTISHELKSPLVTVKSFLGFLKMDLKADDSEKVDKDIDFMNTATDKMKRILDELLEMSRVGRMINEPVSVRFDALVKGALASLAGAIAERGVTVQVNDSAMTLLGDPLRLEEIWQNLIENALKYMGDQPAPRLEIGVSVENDSPVFYLRDNGIGIDPRYHKKIFELFDKLDAKSDGTGLGLALIKRIVEVYDGRIWVESKGVGHGSCFKFTLPEAVKG